MTEFDIVNFPFLDSDVPRSTSHGVYISQLIRFARVASHVADFNARNKSLKRPQCRYRHIYKMIEPILLSTTVKTASKNFKRFKSYRSFKIGF